MKVTAHGFAATGIEIERTLAASIAAEIIFIGCFCLLLNRLIGGLHR